MKKNKDLKLHSANITATVYFNADNGFFIGKTDEGFSVKASNVVMPILGEAIIYGGFEVDPKYGRQLVAHKIFFKDPNQAVKMLVSSGFLTGIKSHKAAELFVTLGKRIFEVLDKAIEDPEALMVWNGKNMLPKEVLCTVKGIGPVVADQIIASYAKKKSRLGVSILSVQAGLTMRQYLNALAIIGPDKLTELILREPYSLSTISHFDWETVDLIAQLDWEGKEPIPHDSATRLSAALREAINIEYKNGHMACPFDKAIAVAEDLANTVGLWEVVKPRVTNEGMICYKNKDGQKMITLTPLFEMERESAKRIVELRNAKPKFAPPPSNLEIGNFSDLTLAPEQDEAIQAALTNNVTIITGGPGTGKCLAPGTPVLLYNGEVVPVERVRVGDLLMGPDSKPRQVLALGHGYDDMYQVTPTKGDPYVVNSAHILSVKMSNSGGRRSYDGKTLNVNVIDFMNQSNRWKHHAKGWRTGVEFEYQSVPVDPYLVGLWLGDGTSDLSSFAVTTEDVEIDAFLTGFAYSYDLHVTRVQTGNADTLKLSGTKGKSNPISLAFRDLGLHKNKHIPMVYKANDRNTRLQVLAGIIDTDGHLTHTGTYDVVQKNETLANDIAYVARSLGFSAYIRPAVKSSQNGTEGLYYRISISGEISEIPVHVNRKIAACCREQKKDVLVTGIKVEPVGYGEYFGFQIDGDGLFLLGDFTVTHNTTILKTLIRIFRKHDVTFTLCAPTGKAAVRMEEATDERAATLHREFQFFKPDRSDWIFCETNYLIVDEASMLSADLFHSITEIIHPGQRLILLGDADQLPPVGPGEVLIQMMQTEKTVRLKQIYRQSKNSGIIVAAHDINEGKYPENDSDNGFILEHARSQNAVAKVLDWIEKLGQDTMILTPVNKGPVGREFLNRVLQDRFNPVGERVPGTFFRVGDKVIQTKNDYNIDVMNGEIGVITEIVNGSGDFSIDNDNVVMRVLFERREQETRITKSQTDNIQLAYALTIHKTQGSQYDNVIVLMPPVYHEFFLRQLPYTGITRGASTVVAIDIDRNMDRYIKNEKKLRRVSILSDLISAAEEYETTDHPE